MKLLLLIVVLAFCSCNDAGWKHEPIPLPIDTTLNDSINNVNDTLKPL